jgi:hypothetical protein
MKRKKIQIIKKRRKKEDTKHKNKKEKNLAKRNLRIKIGIINSNLFQHIATYQKLKRKL